MHTEVQWQIFLALSTMKLAFKTLSTEAEMLPHLPVLQHMYPDLIAEQYTKYLAEMLPMGYKQIVAYQEGDEDEKPVGLLAYWLITRLWSGRTFDLDNFVVLPEYRSLGIGAQMLAHAEQLAQSLGCTKVVLDAYTANHKAQKFYLMHDYVQLGFHLVKKLPTQQQDMGTCA